MIDVMTKFVGLFLKAGYQLRRHEWMGIALDRWIALALLMVAGLIAIRWLPGGLQGALICAVLFAALLIIQGLAGRMNHVIFQTHGDPTQATSGSPRLAPMDKLLLRATGRFEVEGKQQSFTELQAYFRSFETREHAVMAFVPPSLFLLLGRWPGHEIGMWYMFFKNDELRRVQVGELCFGTRLKPAIRLDLEQTLPPESSPLDVWGGYRSGKKRKPKIRRQTIYLTFDSPGDRKRVLDDLLVDATKLAL